MEKPSTASCISTESITAGYVAFSLNTWGSFSPTDTSTNSAEDAGITIKSTFLSGCNGFCARLGLLIIKDININTTINAAPNNIQRITVGVAEKASLILSFILFAMTLYPYVFHCILTTRQPVTWNFISLSHNVCAVSISSIGPMRKRYSLDVDEPEPKSPTPWESTAKNTLF